MIASSTVSKCVKAEIVKFTWTSKRELRVKVPVGYTDKQAQDWLEIGERAARELGDTEFTLRGKVVPGSQNYVTMKNDSKTKERTIKI